MSRWRERVQRFRRVRAFEGFAHWFFRPGLLEDKMSHFGFEIPIDYRDRGQVERGVRNHKHENSACDRESRSKNKAGDNGLFEAGESLVSIMGQAKQYGGKQHD